MKFKDINMDKSILLFDYIDEYSIKEATNRLGEVLENGKYKGEIYLMINSYGGYIEPMFGFLDTLKAVENKIITVAFGVAMSAGAVLLSIGDERYMTANTDLMIHEVSGGASGTVEEQKNSIQRSEELQLKLFDILAEKTNSSGQELLDTVKGKNWYLNSNTALELGLITAILDDENIDDLNSMYRKNVGSKQKNIIQKGSLMPATKNITEASSQAKPDETVAMRMKNLEERNVELETKVKNTLKELAILNTEKAKNTVLSKVNARGITLKREEDGSEKELGNLIKSFNVLGEEALDLMLNGLEAKSFKNQDLEIEQYSEVSLKGLINAFKVEHKRKPTENEILDLADKIK